MMDKDKPEFWGKKDEVSVARSLRLATVRNVFEQGMISREDAKDVLSGPLSPDNPATVYDDSEWIDKPFVDWVPDKI